jgi:hypothetical protein
MDCAAEEQMVRMQLQGMEPVRYLDFDLGERVLTVYHLGERDRIAERLGELGLGERLRESAEVSEADVSAALSGAGPGAAGYHGAGGDHGAGGYSGDGADAGAGGAPSEANATQSRLLWTVLAINASFFVIEMTTGLISRSMGLVADSLDMLADAVVYGLSLWAVGAAVRRKKRVATLSGYFQLTLAAIGLAEVIRRFVGMEGSPDFVTMMAVSAAALVANGVSLYLLQRSGEREAHIKASMIFTSNDVIINLGVIAAGAMVLLTDSRYPDLIVGAIVFIIVLRGALRILKLGR